MLVPQNLIRIRIQPLIVLSMGSNPGIMFLLYIRTQALSTPYTDVTTHDNYIFLGIFIFYISF